MKAIKKILFIAALVVMLLPLKTNAATDNTVNMYLFYGAGCPHCAALEEAMKKIEPKYPNLKIHKYEVWGSSKNRQLMSSSASVLNTKATGVPFAIIGTRTFSGYSETTTLGEIEYTIKVYASADSYKDPVGDMLGYTTNGGTKTYDDLVKQYDKNDTNKDKSIILDVPFIGKVDTKTLSLPIIAVVIGTIDGFNPCAMWVLLFLISVLIGMKDRKRMWILGSTFLIASALIYLVFMLAWLNVAIFIGAIWWVKMLIAAVALIGGFINVRTYIKTKDTGCEVVDEQKRKKIFAKVKKFTSEQSFALAILGIVTLAVSVNFIELTCSAGLPVIFANILAVNHLSIFEYALYIFIYLLFFLLDDLIVFFIAMKSLKLTGISNKYAKYSHLIGGIIMLLIGILMIFKPEWLMFNF